MSILDHEIRVDHDAERISVFNGSASLDFNGNEAQRREAMAFYEQMPDLARRLGPLARFVAAFDAKPIRGIDDVLYGIHSGSEYEADIRLSDLRAIVHVLRDAKVLP